MPETQDAITKDMVINDVVRKYPQTMPVFARYNVDSCCGGGFSIEATATKDGVDVEALLRALNEAAQRG